MNMTSGWSYMKSHLPLVDLNLTIPINVGAFGSASSIPTLGARLFSRTFDLVRVTSSATVLVSVSVTTVEAGLTRWTFSFFLSRPSESVLWNKTYAFIPTS